MADAPEDPKLIHQEKFSIWKALAGLILLTLGVGFAWPIVQNARPATVGEWLTAIGMGACFTLLCTLPALWLIGGRYEVELSRRDATVTTRWGWLVNLTERTRTLEEMAAIVLDPDSDNPDRFEIDLRLRNGNVIRLQVGTLSRREAERYASEVADYLPLPILEQEEYDKRKASGSFDNPE